MKSKKWDWLICLVLAVALFAFVSQLPATNEKARVYPMVVLAGSYLMIALTLVNWFRARKSGAFKNLKTMEAKRVVYIAVYCVAIFVYIFLIERLGFIISSVLFGIYSLIYMKNKNKIVIIVLPIVVTLVLYLIFKNFLFVTLPAGILKGVMR